MTDPAAPAVAIDGRAGAGKTTAGVWLARRLEVPYIESGYLFRGLAIAVDGLASLPHIDIDVEVPPDDGWRPSLRLHGSVVEDLRTPAIEGALASLAKQPAVRSAAAERVTELAAQRGAVVVGRRTATESCSTAAARILMTADTDVRLRRCSGADARHATKGYGARMHAREPALQGDESIYTMKLDTTELSIDAVREALWRHVGERLES